MGHLHDCVVLGGRDLCGLGGHGAARHEKTGGVFIRGAHGLRDLGLLYLQPAGRVGWLGANDCSRFCVSGHVLVNWRAV